MGVDAPTQTRDGTLTWGKTELSEYRLLACFAHPDDEAFPVGAAIAAHASRGVDCPPGHRHSGRGGRNPPGRRSATRATIGSVRRSELAASAQTLGIASHDVLNYRDSGMAGTPPNQHPQAYINAGDDPIVERLIQEIRSFRPQVVLTFGPDGLYGHPDHIAISRHTLPRPSTSPATLEIYPQQLVRGRAHSPPAGTPHVQRSPPGFPHPHGFAAPRGGHRLPPAFPPERANDGVPTLRKSTWSSTPAAIWKPSWPASSVTSPNWPPTGPTRPSPGK